jgi:glycosyltransferase involved in cell wall biosynthesis
MVDEVVIAILAKDKAHILPTYLQCLLNQTYPKGALHLYIRTNDNTDDTETILRNFVEENKGIYASIYFDPRSIDASITQYAAHEWNSHRFRILGNIRQESIAYAKGLDAHYFVADCDNLIAPETLSAMVSMQHLGIVAPLLRSVTNYSNYHFSVSEDGYFQENTNYYAILHGALRGCIQVAVVHCTYFIAGCVLDAISYDDGSARHEYVIFSDVLRKKGIPQYIDTRQEYGTLTFAVTREEFQAETIHSVTLV